MQGEGQLTPSFKPLLRIERLLSSPSLHLGANRIRPYSTETLGPRSLHVFVAHVESLALEENELIVLDYTEQELCEGVSDDSALADTALSKLALRFNGTHIWYISPYLHGLTTVRRAGFRLSTAEPNELFFRILALPAEFSAAVASDVDVNGYTYKKAFQRRSAMSPPHISAAGSEEDLDSLDTELARWADSSGVESPLLLLGDRGSGKTWQLLKFCEEQYKRNRESPWLHPPAFYVSLRGVLGYMMDSHRSSLGLYGLLNDRYSWFSVKWNVAMFQALLECNQVIICLDGLDEVEVQPSEAAVREHFRRLVCMLPMGSRFVISSRTTYFSSFDRLYSLETWPGVDVSGSFRILELAPFGVTHLTAYASVVAESEGSSGALERLNELLRDDGRRDELARALRRCSRQPALLARLVNEINASHSVTDFQLLQRAIEGSLIGFNVEFERTRPLHLDAQGELRTFDTRARIAFLGELAWFMAERHLDAIDLHRLPARLMRMFGLDSEALLRDIRSQTVFELVESPASPSDRSSEPAINLPRMPGSESTPASVRFGFCLEDFGAMSPGSPAVGSDVSAVPRRSKAPVEREVRLSASVAESYFLASHIAARLADSGYIPGVMLTDTLQYLGRIRLDDLTAVILHQMLEKNSQTPCNPRELVEQARRCVTNLAREGHCRVFTQSLRFLMQNLESLGYLSTAERVQLDPWTSNLSSILRYPGALGIYGFVLVPGACSQKIARTAKAAGATEATAPFLLGVHEVTNEQFANFILSPEGFDWAVERVTRAGSDGSTPPSPCASRTNEYHLYFWEEVDGAAGIFRPPSAFLRYPVVYVSWYAAQAFCNWLSRLDSRTPVHLPENAGRTAAGQASEPPGFRLPTAAEWWWSAQGPNDRAEYPWEILPYDCAAPATAGSADAIGFTEAIGAQEWFRRYRDAAKDVLLDSGRRSAEVAYDDDVGPLGAIGLIGNVKEWVDDLVSEASSTVPKALVCGATAHLGKPSFRIGYYATLFPENTNPDVGFRVARSLAASELTAFMSRETELAALPWT